MKCAVGYLHSAIPKLTASESLFGRPTFNGGHEPELKDRLLPALSDLREEMFPNPPLPPWLYYLQLFHAPAAERERPRYLSVDESENEGRQVIGLVVVFCRSLLYSFFQLNFKERR